MFIKPCGSSISRGMNGIDMVKYRQKKTYHFIHQVIKKEGGQFHGKKTYRKDHAGTGAGVCSEYMMISK